MKWSRRFSWFVFVWGLLGFLWGCPESRDSAPRDDAASNREGGDSEEELPGSECDCGGDGDGDADFEVNEGMAVAVSPEGDILVTGKFVSSAIFGKGESVSKLVSESRMGSAFVARYTPAGDLVYARQAFGSAYSRGNWITGTQDGVVVAGWYDGGVTLGEGENEISLEGEEIFIAKYDSTGDLRWAKNLTNATGDSGVFSLDDMGTLRGNEILLYGDSASRDPEIERSFITVLNDEGETVSTRYLDRAHGGNLTVSPDGMFYLWGNKEDELTLDNEPFPPTLSNRDELFVARLTAEIAPVWAVESNTQFLVEDEYGGENTFYSSVVGTAIAWHGQGGAVLLGTYGDQFSIGTGSSEVTFGEGIDQGDPDRCFLARFDDSGNLRWTLNTVGDGGPDCTDVGVVKDDRVVFTGSFDSGISLQDGDGTRDFKGKNCWCWPDYFIAAYDSDSRLLWARTVIGERAVHSRGLAVSEEGAVYVTGSVSANANFRDEDHPLIPTVGDGLAYDYLLVKYTAEGEVEWLAETE